jgi:ATP-dependent 26S proteasome regulatory subunit
VLRADALPLEIDKSTSMESVGGLDEHLESLKEMVSLPLMYPEVFERFGLQPPRGVLFHGPPGTGKVIPVQFGPLARTYFVPKQILT